MYSVVPGNICAHPMECGQKFQEGGGGGFKSKYFHKKEALELNGNFQRGGGEGV